MIDGDVFYPKGPETRFAVAAHFYRLEESEAYDGGAQAVAGDTHDLVMQSAWAVTSCLAHRHSSAPRGAHFAQ